jgi:hypothetical protein
MEKRTILGQDTLVPISVIAVVFGACVWLTTVWAQGHDNAASIIDLKAQQDKNLDKIEIKLEKIESKLEDIRKELHNGNRR